MLKKLIIPIGPPNKNDEFFLAFHAEGKKKIKKDTYYVISNSKLSLSSSAASRGFHLDPLHCQIPFSYIKKIVQANYSTFLNVQQ